MRTTLLMIALVVTLLAPGVAAADSRPPDGELGPIGAPWIEATAAGATLGLAAQGSAPLSPAGARGLLIEYTTPVSPTNLLQAPDGLVWFTSFYSNTVGSLDPSSSAVRLYQLRPELKQSVLGIERDATGNIWYSTARALGGDDSVGRLNPVTGQADEWTLPWNHYNLRIDAQTQNVWFVSKGPPDNHLARLKPASNEMARWNLSPYTDTYDLDIAPNGQVWFTVQPRGQQVIGRLNPATNQATVWKLPVSTAAPFRIDVIGDNEIWLTEFDKTGNSVSRFNPSTGKLAQYKLPVENVGPAGILKVGAYIWFTEYRGNSISRLDPALGTPTETTLTSSTFTAPVTVSTAAPVRFTAAIKKSVSSVARSPVMGVQSGPFLRFPLPHANSYPLGIAAGAGNSIWVAQQEAPRIALLSQTAVFLPMLMK